MTVRIRKEGSRNSKINSVKTRACLGNVGTSRGLVMMRWMEMTAEGAGSVPCAMVHPCIVRCERQSNPKLHCSFNCDVRERE